VTKQQENATLHLALAYVPITFEPPDRNRRQSVLDGHADRCHNWTDHSADWVLPVRHLQDWQHYTG